MQCKAKSPTVSYDGEQLEDIDKACFMELCIAERIRKDRKVLCT